MLMVGHQLRIRGDQFVNGLRRRDRLISKNQWSGTLDLGRRSSSVHLGSGGCEFWLLDVT